MNPTPEQKQPSKLSRIVYAAVMVLLLAVFAISAFMLIKYYVESAQSQQTYQGLQDLRGQYTRPPLPSMPVRGENEGEPTTPVTQPGPELTTVTDPETGEIVELLPQFAELYVLNPDLVGWITVPNTNIDYPVVQRKETADYYLYRDFYGRHDTHGCIYVREACNVDKPSDNLTIYGHRMKDHTMFGHLARYEKQDYWQENQYVYFDTLTEYHTYQIVYVFTTTASVGEGFQYHTFVDAANQQEFDRFIQRCEVNSIYDTGLTATYGDKLITLSTCEYTQQNGRLVIVAKRID